MDGPHWIPNNFIIGHVVVIPISLSDVWPTHRELPTGKLISFAVNFMTNLERYNFCLHSNEYQRHRMEHFTKSVKRNMSTFWLKIEILWCAYAVNIHLNAIYCSYVSWRIHFPAFLWNFVANDRFCQLNITFTANEKIFSAKFSVCTKRGYCIDFVFRVCF